MDIYFFGVSVLSIVVMIVFTTTISKLTKIPPWVVVVPVAFALYKVVSLDTIFFNQEKTGIVSGVLQKV